VVIVHRTPAPASSSMKKVCSLQRHPVLQISHLLASAGASGAWRCVAR